MINLEVCDLCHREFSWESIDIEREMREAKRTGVLACPSVLQGIWEAIWRIDGPVPGHCPFRTEQVIMEVPQ